MFLIGAYAVWEQDINDDVYPDVKEKLPLLYKNFKTTDLFSYKRYLIWSLMGVTIAVVLDYFINLTVAEVNTIVNASGYPATYD
jgi:hypothetical protein